MSACVQYPTVGCLVEFFDASSPQTGLVLEEAGGKLRLFLYNRRETKLPATRVLPWISPPVPGFSTMSRDDMVKLLDNVRKKRAELADGIDVKELWEMAQGEVDAASAQWFAELLESEPDADLTAACGHALLACRTHFRFVPPRFEVYDAEKVTIKEEESRKQRERETVLAAGQPFVRALWNAATGRGALPDPADWPQAEICDRIESLILARMRDPEGTPDPVWPLLIKGLQDDHVLPAQLLMAWGKIPPHYNFWYDRAGYERGDTWWADAADEAYALAEHAQSAPLPVCELPFVSIDGDSTLDIDDAFHIEAKDDGGFSITIALACPVLGWTFDSRLDHLVQHRATSVYLPEGDSHMLPEFLGKGAFSLLEKQPRPALLVHQNINPDGSIDGECHIEVARITVAANLRYNACQAVLNGAEDIDPATSAWAPVLSLARQFGEKRLASRIARGAVSLERREPALILEGSGWDTIVHLTPGSVASPVQNMVAEMMILASAVTADWAVARRLPLLFRTQNVALPREYAGVWSDPVITTEIMRCMIPSSLETEPHRHAALALDAYAPITSPLRRYADLVNVAQLMAAAADKEPPFDARTLKQRLLPLRMAVDAASQIQRFRTRYWKLLFFKQRGDKHPWHGVVTEENENSVSVALPEYDFFLRGRRRLFDERCSAGSRVVVFVGKVNPLTNDIHIVKAMNDEDVDPAASFQETD